MRAAAHQGARPGWCWGGRSPSLRVRGLAPSGRPVWALLSSSGSPHEGGGRWVAFLVFARNGWGSSEKLSGSAEITQPASRIQIHPIASRTWGQEPASA